MKEEESLRKRIQYLEGLVAEQKNMIDMSNVETVRKAILDAEAAQEFAMNYSKNCDRDKETVVKESIRKVTIYKEKAESSLYRQFLSYSVVGVFLLIISAIHYHFWTDLFYFFKVPTGWATDAISNLISNLSEGYAVWRWIRVVFITLLYLSGLGLFGVLIAMIRKRWNILTFISLEINLGISILVGDFLPFNRIILLLTLTIAYLILCRVFDGKFDYYPVNETWESFQKELRIKRV